MQRIAVPSADVSITVESADANAGLAPLNFSRLLLASVGAVVEIPDASIPPVPQVVELDRLNVTTFAAVDAAP
jgi:hypothetical protein